mmetsp:Transcript_81093/g.143658  ORF Transcript_81093/g.143658 Transcript_81093/m.143658 type:complete len:199 (+) Transcript_81093:46-642(+)
MQYITPLRFFLLCKVVYSASQQSTEEEEGLTSIQAIVAYGLIAVPLSILCICAAYKRFSGKDRPSSSATQTPGGISCPQTPKSAHPQTPTLLGSRRAASFNEKKEKDLESGDLEEIDLDDSSISIHRLMHSQAEPGKAFGSKEPHEVAADLDNTYLASETSETSINANKIFLEPEKTTETFSIDDEGRVNVTQGSIDG